MLLYPTPEGRPPLNAKKPNTGVPGINFDVVYGRTTGTCCWGCAKRDNCPMEAVGRRCRKDHTTCPGCTWWGGRGCYAFAIDKNLLKME
jgi:hypothetical protein